MKIRTMVYKLKKLLASEQTYVNILKRGGVKINVINLTSSQAS